MKATLLLIFVLVVTTTFSQKKQSLFNGKNLKGWTVFVSAPNIKPENFFYVNDHVIETVGVPNGYLLSTKEYSDYHLHLEWRYPENPTNSGIFLHTNGPDKIWPAHYQCQLKHGNAGDFIVHGVGLQAKIKDSLYVSTEKVKPLVAKFVESNEKAAGEWNQCDIICKGNTIEMKINGVLQNVGKDCSHTKGKIGFQAEGSKIQFRNIWIEKAK